MFSVDLDRVDELSETLVSIRLSESFALQITPQVNADAEPQLRAILWSAAICHSTHGGLQGIIGGQWYNGWDFLLRAFITSCVTDPSSVSPDRIMSLTGDDLHRLLVRSASEATIKLEDLDRRAQILRGCAEALSRNYDSKVTALLEECDHRVGGPGGAYERFAQLEAFQDELHKKSSAFLMSVYFGGLWQIQDLENVVPMIDYHRMRLLCRTGCIRIHDAQVEDDLRSRRMVSAAVETDMRKMALEVCRHIGERGQLSMFELDVLLWAHARSCCRHSPVCAGGALENSLFYELVAEPFAGRCVFESWCPGARNVAVRTLWEPQVSTELY
jgi:hypothetical protein